MQKEVIASDMLTRSIIAELGRLFPHVQRTSEFVSEANTRFPQFFVQILTNNKTQATFGYDNLNHFVNIVYRDRANPSANPTQLQNALNRMAFDLTTQFNNIIWFSRPLRVLNKRYEIVDNNIQFFCEFSVNIELAEEEIAKQLKLEINKKLI